MKSCICCRLGDCFCYKPSEMWACDINKAYFPPQTAQKSPALTVNVVICICNRPRREQQRPFVQTVYTTPLTASWKSCMVSLLIISLSISMTHQQTYAVWMHTTITIWCSLTWPCFLTLSSNQFEKCITVGGATSECLRNLFYVWKKVCKWNHRSELWLLTSQIAHIFFLLFRHLSLGIVYAFPPSFVLPLNPSLSLMRKLLLTGCLHTF